MKFLAQNVDLTVGVLTFYVQRVLHTKASTLGIIKESLFSLQWLCSIYMLDIFFVFCPVFFKKKFTFFCPNSPQFCPNFFTAFCPNLGERGQLPT